MSAVEYEDRHNTLNGWNDHQLYTNIKAMFAIQRTALSRANLTCNARHPDNTVASKVDA